MKAHKRVWRVALLVLLLVAILGPWTFDLIVVPSQYPCSLPNIRLEGDYCGLPLSGIWIFSQLAAGLANMIKGLVTGTIVFTDQAREFTFSVLGLLLFLPFFSTLFLVLRGDRRGSLVFHLVAWSLAAGLGLLLALSSYPQLAWALWGVWLYVGLAASALVLEVGLLAARRSPGQG